MARRYFELKNLSKKPVILQMERYSATVADNDRLENGYQFPTALFVFLQSIVNSILLIVP